MQDTLGVAAGGDQPHGRKLRDTGARQVQNTLDPLLEEITHSYVDDDDLTARLNILFEVPPRSQASKRRMHSNRSFSLQPMRLCLSSRLNILFEARLSPHRLELVVRAASRTVGNEGANRPGPGQRRVGRAGV